MSLERNDNYSILYTFSYAISDINKLSYHFLTLMLFSEFIQNNIKNTLIKN